ncbi:hypothetical protein BKA56DRAFT_665727 [Ilyonectria sp. MPI-CAGE-AT-0026]|nr:hypothetical protein BKA56DRAFT_665727 [Ilyonectria sp. MPI-CAGE-AT-0026]
MAPVIIVEMYAKDTPAAIEGLKRTLNEAAKHYKNSQGTIEWLPIQDIEDERAFTVFEKFESEQDIAAHREHPYRATFLAGLKEVLEGPPKPRSYREFV